MKKADKQNNRRIKLIIDLRSKEERVSKPNRLPMDNGIMNESWTKTLSDALGLKRYEQDWGICNADPARVIEFIEFYNQHIPQHSWEPEALAELILASADDGCSDGTLSESIKSIVRCFIKVRHKEFPYQWAYWSKLDSREFPVVELLVTEGGGQHQ